MQNRHSPLVGNRIKQLQLMKIMAMVMIFVELVSIKSIVKCDSSI